MAFPWPFSVFQNGGLRAPHDDPRAADAGATPAERPGSLAATGGGHRCDHDVLTLDIYVWDFNGI